jgi:hypothetical protein
MLSKLESRVPSNLLSEFTTLFAGIPAARFATSDEALRLEIALREKGVSYQTKIRRSKERGREFVVILLETAGAA